MRSPAESVVVARVGELGPGETRKFVFRRDGREIEAFVLNFEGTLYAYLNRCRHIAMTMDWVENQFLTEDGQFIQCATHGACYRPDTGECVYGPPVGKVLVSVPLTIRGEEIVASCPDDAY
jgi:nitrite reductase/ring-hydroxylating ferredoxin subunit